jgi:hypothetical protein
LWLLETTALKSPSTETEQYPEVRRFDYHEDKGKTLNADSVILMAEVS